MLAELRELESKKKFAQGLHLSSNKIKRITITRRSNLNSNKWLHISQQNLLIWQATVEKKPKIKILVWEPFDS